MLATEAKPAATPAPVQRSGAGFFQRVSSFLVGAGLTALASQYYIYQELVDGNALGVGRIGGEAIRLDSA